MTTNLQNAPYLPRQRNFPTENAKELGQELDRSYIDIAYKVNVRTIGIFTDNMATITGETWYLTGEKNKQQTLRQVYQFTNLNPINHGINFANVSTFTVIRGIGFDGTNYIPIPYIDALVAGFNLGIFVTPTQIIFRPGPSRTLTSGIIILEWLSTITTNT